MQVFEYNQLGNLFVILLRRFIKNDELIFKITGMFLELDRKLIQNLINDNDFMYGYCVEAIRLLNRPDTVEIIPKTKSLKKNIGQALLNELVSVDKTKYLKFIKKSSLDDLFEIYCNEEKLKLFVDKYETCGRT